jgi:hypothetical protein
MRRSNSLRQLKRPSAKKKTAKDNLAARGERFYREKLKAILEPSETGKFVAIEPSSGNYFVNESDIKALLDGLAVFPGRLFYLMRIGHEVAHQMGGAAYGKRKRPR